MSSKYAELEIQQQVISLQGQADMIQEIEIIMKFINRRKNTISKRKWFLTLLSPINGYSLDEKFIKLLKKKKKLKKIKETNKMHRKYQ